MGKKMNAAIKNLEPRVYGLREAVEAVKRSAYAKFDESVDLALRLGIDPRGKRFASWYLPRVKRSRRRDRPGLTMLGLTT